MFSGRMKGGPYDGQHLSHHTPVYRFQERTPLPDLPLDGPVEAITATVTIHKYVFSEDRRIWEYQP